MSQGFCLHFACKHLLHALMLCHPPSSSRPTKPCRHGAPFPVSRPSAKKNLTQPKNSGILDKRHGRRSFFYAQKQRVRTLSHRTKEKTAANVSDDRKRKYTVEVEVVRVKITLACTECKQRNYNMTKEKKNHPDRMETKKYCKFCKRHTMHKETK